MLYDATNFAKPCTNEVNKWQATGKLCPLSKRTIPKMSGSTRKCLRTASWQSLKSTSPGSLPSKFAPWATIWPSTLSAWPMDVLSWLRSSRTVALWLTIKRCSRPGSLAIDLSLQRPITSTQIVSTANTRSFAQVRVITPSQMPTSIVSVMTLKRIWSCSGCRLPHWMELVAAWGSQCRST